MPLKQSSSKEAVGDNIKREMGAGKPQKQSIAIALDIQRRNKRKKMAKGGPLNPKLHEAHKKMAEGGDVDGSIQDEKRPMPDDLHRDKEEAGRNRGNKPLRDSDWIGQPTVRQSQNPSPQRMSQPSEPGDNSPMHDEEDDLLGMDGPDGGGSQPRKRLDEDGPNRQGPPISDMSRQHNNGRMPYAKGGDVMRPEDHGMEKMEREDELNMQGRLSPGGRPSRELNEEDADGHGNDLSDHEQPHSLSSGPYRDAMGNEDHDMELNPSKGKFSPDDSEIQPMDEADEERAASLSAAVMSRRKMMADGGRVRSEAGRDRDFMGDDMPEENDEPMLRAGHIARSIMRKRKMMADGGEVDLDLNAQERPNDYYHQNEDVVLKENYDEDLDSMHQPMDSNEHGDEDERKSEDSHDMVDDIRRKMKAKRQR